MKSMDEMYGGDFPVTISVVKKYFTTEIIDNTKSNKTVLSESEKKEEITVENHKLTKKEQVNNPTELAIIDVTPKKFSLRGYKK